MPLKSMRPMTAVRSLPFRVSVLIPPGPPGEISWWVMTPSMRTSGVPPTVATMTQRRMGGSAPPVSKKIVWSGERFETWNCNSNPLVAGKALSANPPAARRAWSWASLSVTRPPMNAAGTGFPGWSRNASDAEGAEAGAAVAVPQRLLLLLVDEVQAPALVAEAEVVDAQHPQAQADLG